jgi:deoxyadenosine/deoxycytidine kinase
MKARYISIEGPIGVGKTSLAQRLARKLDARQVLEDSGNPFLDDFYRDKGGAAFQAQLWFLLQRHRQLRSIEQEDLFQQLTIVDFIFAKDKIFAYLNLNDSELLIYDKLFAVLEKELRKPDLVIYLQAGNDVLLDRIRKRRREVETNISEAYLAEVNKAFNYYFFHFDGAPLLVIDTNQIDFVREEADLDDLVERIQGMDRGGVQYYRPLGSQSA